MAVGTLVTGQRGTISGNQDNRKVDMADKVLLLEPDAAPLTIISKKIGSRKAANPLFKWMEDELDPRFDAVNNGAGYASGATAIVVDNAAYFEVQQQVYVPRTREQMRVTAINTGTNTLTVVRGIGSTAAALVDNDELILANTAQPEGDTAKTPRSRNPTTVSNYLQIFRTPWAITRTAEQSEYEADADWDYQANKHGIEHKKDIEYALMMGRASEDTSSGQARRTTGGFTHFVTTNSLDAAGALTETELFTFMRPAFRYGGKTKWLLASQLVVDVLNGFPRGKLETRQGETTFGLRVMQYVSPHGTLNVTTHYLLEGSTLGGQAWVIDTDSLKWRHLAGSDTHIRKEIQAPDVDGRLDEYLTEGGLEFGQEKRHAFLYGVTS